MRLENEIHQSKFRDEYHKLAVNILYTHGWLVGLMSEALRPHDITIAQFNILRILRGQYPRPATVSLLKERMLDKMSDASRLVERLRVKGLVERATSDNDRRKANIAITSKGIELLSVLGDFDGVMTAIATEIGEDQARSANVVLDAMREAKVPVNGNGFHKQQRLPPTRIS
jgi:DNA-binding MarR family transcriptional regulator